eukprot:3336308-Amphidinium_carterae.1
MQAVLEVQLHIHLYARHGWRAAPRFLERPSYTSFLWRASRPASCQQPHATPSQQNLAIPKSKGCCLATYY